MYCKLGASHGLIVRESDLYPKGCGFESQDQKGLSVGGVNNQRSLHSQYHDWGALEQGTEPPTAPRAPPHWLPTAPGVCSQCVHLDGLNLCRAQIPSMGHVIFLFISFSFSFPFNFRTQNVKETNKLQNF